MPEIRGPTCGKRRGAETETSARQAVVFRSDGPAAMRPAAKAAACRQRFNPQYRRCSALAVIQRKTSLANGSRPDRRVGRLSRDRAVNVKRCGAHYLIH